MLQNVTWSTEQLEPQDCTAEFFEYHCTPKINPIAYVPTHGLI